MARGLATKGRSWRKALPWALVLVFWITPLLGGGVVSPEYKLKAALLYKLTRFIEWPELAKKYSTFGICLLGRDDFGNALDALESRKVEQRPIRIHRFVQSEAVDERCQILFISESKRPFLKPILRTLSRYPILTIGDVEKFAELGGMIEFTRGHKRIGFRINLKQANAVGLKIAAPLLELATIVETTP